MKSKGKAAEPSMDEILASIRKIVAEDPAPASASAAASSQPTAPVSPASHDPQRTRADLDKDIADLMGVGEEPADQGAPAAETPGQGNGTKSSGWFFNRSSSAPAASPPAASAPSGGGRLSETLEMARANIRRATAAAGNSALVPPLFRAKGEDADGKVDSTRDLGAVVPGRYEEIPGGPAAAQAGATPAALGTPGANAHADRAARNPKLASAAGQPAAAPYASLAAPAPAPQWTRNLTTLALTADGTARSPGPAAANGHAGSAPVRTLEDTVADLLRPMLRDWLDANMPRIMERAMRDGSGPKSSS